MVEKMKEIKVTIKFISGEKLEIGMSKKEYEEFERNNGDYSHFKDFKFINFKNAEYIKVKGI